MNTKKNILVLSKLSKNGNDTWTVIEYKRFKKFKDTEQFTWVPNGRNLTFKSRGDAILKMSIEAAELYEMSIDHLLHAFKADLANDLVKVI